MPPTRSVAQTRSGRERAVLRELPLEQFVLDALSPHAPSGKKRPHPSPGGLLSPHKRRILDVEGMLSPSKHHASPSRRRVETVGGPSSPARKLDFASFAAPKSPSPMKLSLLDASDNPFATESPSKTPTNKHHAPKLSASPEIEPSKGTTPTTRGLMTPPDSQPSPDEYYGLYEHMLSVHYPGFVVAVDDPDVPAAAATSLNPNPDSALVEDDKENADGSKENRVPRRKVKNVLGEHGSPKPLRPRVSSPVGASSSLLSPRTTRSPRTSLPMDARPSIDAVLFAKPLVPAHALASFSPSAAERKRRRVELEAEADDETAVDESL